MLDETVDNFEGLGGSRPTLIQGQPIQPLVRRLDVPLSAKLSNKFLCPIESTVLTSQGKLTKSALLDLLGSKSEGRDQFYDYLYQNVCQGWRRRDSGVDTKSVEEVLEGCEKIDQCVVASTHFFNSLYELDVREICR
jgi:hypothetical protein